MATLEKIRSKAGLLVLVLKVKPTMNGFCWKLKRMVLLIRPML